MWSRQYTDGGSGRPAGESRSTFTVDFASERQSRICAFCTLGRSSGVITTLSDCIQVLQRSWSSLPPRRYYVLYRFSPFPKLHGRSFKIKSQKSVRCTLQCNRSQLQPNNIRYFHWSLERWHTTIACCWPTTTFRRMLATCEKHYKALKKQGFNAGSTW